MRVGVLLMVFSALSNVGGICKRRYTKRTFCTFVYIVCVLDMYAVAYIVLYEVFIAACDLGIICEIERTRP